MDKQLLLLVEDSEDDAFLFNWTFEKSGIAWKVHHVRNGFEAIDFLRQASSCVTLPQMIFLDLKMPAMNGFEVLRWMQTQTFSFPVPVVVVSGSAQQEDQNQAFELGAMDYLVKPVRIADLHRLLKVQSNGTEEAAAAKSGARS